MVIRDELLENWPREQAAMRRYRARYYAMISHLDHQVGRLLGCLKARGQLENTIIHFTGDQGLAIGSHGLLGKESMYDHSIASPLIYCGPGIPAGGRSSALVHHVDTFPTLCELAGIPRPSSASFGFSLAPLMNGKQARVRDQILCEFYSPEEPGLPLRHTQRALRTERWKLTYFPLIRRYQLFDLLHDPFELVDLSLPWRKRRRLAVESGEKTWWKDSWAAREPVYTYQQPEVERIISELYQRMIAEMRIHGDPLLTLSPPPPPEL
jgi:arylsulfatase A-like enzyme